MSSRGTYAQDPHETIDPLEVIVGKLYAFTMSPALGIARNIAAEGPKGQSGSQSGFADTYEHIRATLCSCRSMTFRVVPEVSCHGRIHVHGWCRFTNTAKAYTYDLPLMAKYATYCIREIDDPEDSPNKWLYYVYKGHNIWSQLTDDAGLPYHIDTEELGFEASQVANELCESLRRRTITKAKREFLTNC